MRFVLGLLLGLCVACTAPDAATEDGFETVYISVDVPSGTGPVYIAGNLDSLGPWKADGLVLEGKGTTRHAMLERSADQVFEYKFTLGSWDREGLGPSGMVMANYVLPLGQTSATHTVTDFKKDTAYYIQTKDKAGIIGNLTYWQDVPSSHLTETRHVTIWTPPGYNASTQDYPVIYMSDGHNLFDPRIANTGVDWGADEAMALLMEQGLQPAIIVATWSTAKRAEEYSPWHGAPDYAAFLIEELMPRIEADYRVKTGAANTFHVGSSMGGLLSYYLVTRHPETFGACGCVSTHTPFSEAVVAEYFPDMAASENRDTTPYILRDIEGDVLPAEGARFWFDYGTLGLDAAYEPGHERLREWLLANGRSDGTDFIIREYEGADHNERSWRERLPDIFTFLLDTEGPSE